MRVNFEEKTYESYFNNELDKMSSFYFPPGQVVEGALGFDVSAQSKNGKLWKILGHPYFPFHGANLQDVARTLNRNIGHIIDSIPNVKANLFIQYKKPEYITRPNGREWGSWGQKYFRYSINMDQQRVLESIDRNFGDRALVIYAAPAISSLNDLIQCKINGKIIDNSNFQKAIRLTGHSRNTYIQSGTHSKAFSEPKEIEKINLISEIESIEPTDATEASKFIQDTSATIIEILKKNAPYNAAFIRLMEEYRELQEFKILYSHLVMKCFREITGIQWLVSISE